MRPGYYFISEILLTFGIIFLGVTQVIGDENSLEVFRSHINDCYTNSAALGESLISCLQCVQNSKDECNRVCLSTEEDESECTRNCWRYAKYGTFSCRTNLG
uniref:Uncharacterized protein n=1 Tax=Trichobilharzia regenti TaxID=157069 RepID=A0AA85IST4_TRIRE|nr:unnamed protein product [Trichobilharzia regenti]